MKPVYFKILLVFVLCASISGCSDTADSKKHADTRSEGDVGKDATDASEQEGDSATDTEDSPDTDGRCTVDSDCVQAPHQAHVCDTSNGICVYACDDGFDNCDGDINTGCEADLSQSIEHCGECGNYCSQTSLALRPVCIAEEGQKARCDLDVNNCAEGFVDLNKKASDGCECEITDENDLPDRDGIDANCDGIDGVKNRAVYVAGGDLSGDDGDPQPSGLTPDAPVKTITEGLRIAASKGRAYVIVAAETYPEVVELRSGIGIYGGYTYQAADGDTPASWTRGGGASGVDSALTKVAPRAADIDAASNRPVTNYRTVIATDITNQTVLGGLTIVGMEATTPGASSTALWAKNSEGIVLQNSVILAGKGAIGAAGEEGLAGEERSRLNQCTPFSGGAPGVDAAVTPCANNPPERAASGAQGSPTDATSGALGGPGGQGGRHACQEQASNCGTLDGDEGEHGAAGVTGQNGNAPDSSLGELTHSGWLPLSALPVEAGTRGTAGGGGGAGGRCEKKNTCSDLPLCDNSRLYNGGNGGLGGTGGCGGGPGENGQPGGAAFGIVAINSPLTFLQAGIKLGHGGTGGDGGLGGAGAAGAAGDSGGSGGTTGGSSPVKYGGDGGNGGNGGAGGNGGNGAGGCGGPSIGLALLNSFIDQTGVDITTSTGRAGSPGHGAGDAEDGCAGTLKAVHNFSAQ